MTTLDAILDQMRAIPAPEALAAIDAPVLAGVAMRKEQAMSQRGLMLAGAIAMLVGGFGSLLPASEARAGPIFGIPAEAPSNLLAK